MIGGEREKGRKGGGKTEDKQKGKSNSIPTILNVISAEIYSVGKGVYILRLFFYRHHIIVTT